MASVVHSVAHGFVAGNRIYFTDLVGGTGIVENDVYYVLAAGLTANDFEFSLTDGGAPFTFTTDITSGSAALAPSYDVSTEPQPGGGPTTPATPAAPTLASSVQTDVDGHSLVRLEVTVAAPEVQVRNIELQITREFSGATPVWTNAILVQLAPGVTTFGWQSLGGTHYNVRQRIVSVYGTTSAWSAAGDHTTTAGPDGVAVTSKTADVVIDQNGLTILNGKIFLKDEFGTSVLGPSGFAGSWLDFLHSGLIYNSLFISGSTSDVAVTEVGTGSTLADYAASITTGLPYWVVSASGGTIKIVTDANAAGGKALELSGSGSATNRIYQDVPLRAIQDYTVEVISRNEDFNAAGDLIRVYLSYRDVNHAIIGTRKKIQQFSGGAGDSVYGLFAVNTEDIAFETLGVAPGSTAYMRIEFETVHATATFAFRLSAVAVYPSDIEFNNIVAIGNAALNTASVSGGITFGSNMTLLGDAAVLKDVNSVDVLDRWGFGASWLRFIAARIYNADFSTGSTSDVAVTEVGTGSTIADYKASAGTSGLPFWVVAASDGTVKVVSDSNASQSRALDFLQTAASQTNRVYQDLPVTPGSQYQFDYNWMATITGVTDFTLSFDYSWRDSTHAIIGSSVGGGLLYDAGSPPPSAYTVYHQSPLLTGGTAPKNAAYMRVKIEVVHNAFTAVTKLSDVRFSDFKLTEVVGKGTAFPTSPSLNDIFFRTDLGYEFFYNGTRWLSTAEYEMPFEGRINLAATDTDTDRMPAPSLRGGSDIWLESVYVSGFFINGGTALSASHKWVTTVKRLAHTSGSQTTIATHTISSGSLSTWRAGSVVTIDALLGSDIMFLVAYTKTGTPGNLYIELTLTYRIVAT